MEDVLWFARDDAGATAIVSGTEHRHLQALARRRGPRHAACGRAIGMSRRDHLKRGTLQIVFGLLCTADGCPIAVQVFEGSRTSLPDRQRVAPSGRRPSLRHRSRREADTHRSGTTSQTTPDRGRPTTSAHSHFYHPRRLRTLNRVVAWVSSEIAGTGSGHRPVRPRK